jgi:integrase
MHEAIGIQNRNSLVGLLMGREVQESPAVAGLLDEYFDSYVKTYVKSWKQSVYYVNKVREFFGSIKLDEINGHVIAKFTSWLISKKIKTTTVNRYLQFVKAFLNKLREWGYPAEVVKIRLFREDKKTVFFSQADISKLLRSDYLKSQRTRHLLDFIAIDLMTGMRMRELLGLTWDQVNFEAGVITLLDTKGGTQTLQMSADLKAYLENMTKDGPYVIQILGERLDNVLHSFKSLMKCEGIYKPGFCVHTLRHTFASQLAMAGCDMPTLQKLMRHKSINTTMRYTHLSQAHQKEELSKIDKIMEGAWTTK